MSVSAIIVAGGKGIRMGSATRKQYLLLAGKPIVCRTLQCSMPAPASKRFILSASATTWIPALKNGFLP